MLGHLLMLVLLLASLLLLACLLLWVSLLLLMSVMFLWSLLPTRMLPMFYSSCELLLLFLVSHLNVSGSYTAAAVISDVNTVGAKKFGRFVFFL
jgi:hypothetical protein